MYVPDLDSLRPPSTESEPRPTTPSDSGSLEAQWSALRSELLGILSGAKRAIAIEGRRATLLVVDACFFVFVSVSLLAFLLTVSISAALRLVRGVRGGLHAWSGSEWVADFGAGALVVLAILGGGFALRAFVRGSLVRRARRLAAGAP